MSFIVAKLPGRGGGGILGGTGQKVPVAALAATGLKDQKFGASEPVSGPDQTDLMVERAGIGPRPCSRVPIGHR
jgi:hypothetical protein